MSKNSIRILCPDCGDLVAHECHNAVHTAVVDLLSWVPEGFATEKLEKAVMAAGRERGWIDKKDTAKEQFSHPFFGSQAWSYAIFGDKDTARSFHAHIHNLIRAVGLDPAAIEEEIALKRERKEQEEKERLARVKKRRDEAEAKRLALIAFLQGDAPLEERIAKLDEILLQYSTYLKPYEKDEKLGFGYLYKILEMSYGGGINFQINKARISKLESEVFNQTNSQ